MRRGGEAGVRTGEAGVRREGGAGVRRGREAGAKTGEGAEVRRGAGRAGVEAGMTRRNGRGRDPGEVKKDLIGCQLKIPGVQNLKRIEAL